MGLDLTMPISAATDRLGAKASQRGCPNHMIAAYSLKPARRGEGAMKTIASMAILLGFAGTAVAQESVSPYRLGSWVPRDTNSCDTIYGDGRQLCLADRYHIQQDDKASEQQGSLQRAQEENQRLRNELLRRELAQTPSPSAASPTSTADFASIPAFCQLARREPLVWRGPSPHRVRTPVCEGSALGATGPGG